MKMIKILFLILPLSLHALEPGETSQVNAFSICKVLKNNSSSISYFIPTGAPQDWQAFIDNPPSEINISECITYEWEEGPWSSCSNPCDSGTRTRSVTCIDNNGNPSPEINCTATKPSSNQACNVGVTSSCLNPSNYCTGSNFASSNSCNSPSCIGTKAIINPTYTSWSSWSAWSDPGPGGCNASCERTLTRTRTKQCQAGNSCGSSNCTGPTRAVGGIVTETETNTVSCSPGEGACTASEPSCNNSIEGEWCPGKQFYSWGTGDCTKCASNSCQTELAAPYCCPEFLNTCN